MIYNHIEGGFKNKNILQVSFWSIFRKSANNKGVIGEKKSYLGINYFSYGSFFTFSIL
jgi:hypothetical protein